MFDHPPPQKKILMLGGSGFIGSFINHAINLWNNGVDHRKIGEIVLYKPSSAELPLGDRRAFHDAVCTIKPDSIINMAAQSDPSQPKEIQAALNADSVRLMMECLTDTAFKGRFIQASSAYVYGPHNRFCQESDPTDPFCAYAAAKIQAEQACLKASPMIDTVIVRIFSTIGKGHRSAFLMPKLVSGFRQKTPLLDLGSDTSKDWIDVRDVARWIIQLAVMPQHPPAILNLSTGKTHKISALIEKMIQITNHQIKINWQTTGQLRQNDIPEQTGCKKLRYSLGLRRKFSLENSLKWMLIGQA